MKANIEVKEDINSLEKTFKSSKNFKVRQRIQKLLLLREQKFKRQEDLATYLGIGHSTLKI